MERIVKPDWLEGALSHLNWDVFSWQIYVGDAIESAIDWVIDAINTVIEWAEVISAWWDDFRQEVIDGFNSFVDWLNSGWQLITDWIDTWLDRLNEWWQARLSEVKDLIEIAQNWLLDRINEVKQGLGQLEVWWDNFRTVILPSLASHFDITQAINNLRVEWRDLFNTWSEWGRDIADFFSDPFQWIYDRVDDFFERFW